MDGRTIHLDAGRAGQTYPLCRIHCETLRADAEGEVHKAGGAVGDVCISQTGSFRRDLCLS